ncbi:MAG TPA: sortase [Candidatus Woesebacteria bacterium]|nr:sortase [Candidatus Woesebacteria bacterium]
MRFISKVLITIGLLCIAIGSFLLWERNNPNRLAFTTYTQTNYQNTQLIPVRIDIPSIQVNLPIVQSRIEQSNWNTTKDGVSYLSSSPIPGKKGNSILYGHNWSNLLGNLPQVKPGETIEIEYNNGSKNIFTIHSMGVVTPDQTHVLSSSNDTRITLYTCTGFLDSKRLVVTAVLEQTGTKGGLAYEK